MGKLLPQAAHKKVLTLSNSTGTDCMRSLFPSGKCHSVDEYKFSEDDKTEVFLPPTSQSTQVVDEISQDIPVSVQTDLETPLRLILDVISS